MSRRQIDRLRASLSSLGDSMGAGVEGCSLELKVSGHGYGHGWTMDGPWIDHGIPCGTFRIGAQ